MNLQIIINLAILTICAITVECIELQCFPMLSYGWTCDLDGINSTLKDEITVIAHSNSKFNLVTVKLMNLFFIPSDIFKQFVNLTTVLNGSKHYLSRLKSTDLRGAFKLTHLLIPDNNISKLRAGTFSESPNLAFLDLSHNQISIIEDQTFEIYSKFAYILLGHNKLTSISFGTFRGLDKLEQLYLNNNKIKSIEGGAFLTNSKLYLVDLRKNGCVDKEFDPWIIQDFERKAMMCNPDFNPAEHLKALEEKLFVCNARREELEALLVPPS